MEVKDFILNAGPHNPINTVFKYLWFGAGSVPWEGQGKYPLGQLLFLLSGVIIVHQLDILYKMCDALSWYPALVMYLPYVLLLCTATSISYLGMVSICTGTKEGSAVNKCCKGLSHKWAQLVDKYEKPEGYLSGHVLIPQLAHLGSDLDSYRMTRMGEIERSYPERNWYVSMKELIPEVAKMGYCTQYLSGIT